MVIHQPAATRCGIAETLGGNVFSPCESPLHGSILLLCWWAVGKPVFTSRLYWAPVKTRLFCGEFFIIFFFSFRTARNQPTPSNNRGKVISLFWRAFFFFSLRACSDARAKNNGRVHHQLFFGNPARVSTRRNVIL